MIGSVESAAKAGIAVALLFAGFSVGGLRGEVRVKRLEAEHARATLRHERELAAQEAERAAELASLAERQQRELREVADTIREALDDENFDERAATADVPWSVSACGLRNSIRELSSTYGASAPALADGTDPCAAGADYRLSASELLQLYLETLKQSAEVRAKRQDLIEWVEVAMMERAQTEEDD